MLKPLFASTVFAVFLVLVSPLQASEASRIFKKGVDAFRQENYLQAKTAFEAALRQGMDTPSLRYNLGATYYRLGEYAAAERQFQTLTSDPKWQALAHYNLGLIAEKNGEDEQAVAHYRQAKRRGDGKVAGLADRALTRLRGPELPHRLFASLSYGHDDNVTLTPDQVGEGEDDNFWEGFVVGRRYLNKNWSLEGLAYGRRFDEVSEFDIALFGAEVHREHVSGDWKIDNGAGGAVQLLDGERYQDVAHLETSARRSLAAGQALTLDGELAGIRGGDGFEYLDGWRLRGRARWSRPLGDGRLQLGYRLEFNDRDDLTSGDNFVSYSPWRNRVRAKASWPLVADVSLRTGVSYEYSRYQDEHRLNGEEELREDKRLVADARLDWRFAQKWRLFGKYTYTDNSSTLDIYEYERNEVAAGIEYLSF